MPVRKSPRKSIGKEPQRLGMNDDWGAGSAGSWKSDTSTLAAASKAKEDEESSGGSIVGASDVLTTAVGFGLFAYALQLKGLLSADKLTPVMPATPEKIFQLAITAFVIAGSHLIYAYIWYYPKKFQARAKKMPLKMLGKHPVAVFGNVVLGWKMIQQFTFLAFVSGGSVDKLKALLTSWISIPELVVIALVLFVIGQILNVAIYQAIGKDGVYYGFKLGRKVPWSSAFPFNAMYRHPQYVGAMCSQLGVVLAVTTEETLKGGVSILLPYWVLLYVITSIIEASGDNDK